MYVRRLPAIFRQAIMRTLSMAAGLSCEAGGHSSACALTPLMPKLLVPATAGRPEGEPQTSRFPAAACKDMRDCSRADLPQSPRAAVTYGFIVRRCITGGAVSVPRVPAAAKTPARRKLAWSLLQGPNQDLSGHVIQEPVQKLEQGPYRTLTGTTTGKSPTACER